VNDRTRDSPLIVGRLESHGPANYQFRADQSPSYYLKVATNRGVRVLWGKDLARAIAESVTQLKKGSLIGARRTGYEMFAIDGQREIRRGQWIVECIQFFAERAQLARRVRDDRLDARRAVRDRPELLSTYLSMRGAEEIANRRIASPQDRARFLALVREAMAKSIQNGEPLPAIRLREKTQRTSESPPKAIDRKRDEPTR
jgi:hypothetical protein